MSTQFVRVEGLTPPRFIDVPDAVKAPLGPYRQAPAEYQGHWWYVSPFNSATPWIQYDKPVAPPTYPDGFLDTFGPRPQAKDFPNGEGYREALARWEQDLKYFVRVGKPGRMGDAEAYKQLADLYKVWGMGEPKFYEGRYGWATRFPGSQLRVFEAATLTAMEWPHLVIAQYQIELVSQGIVPDHWHPFVPPDFRGE